MTAPKSFYLAELQVTRKRRSIARDAVPSWSESAVVTPRAAAEIFCAVLGTGLIREHFLVLMVNAHSKVIGYELIAIGVGTHVEAQPSEVFRAALLSGATAIILMHNHPSGDPTPSPADLTLTERMARIGEMLGVSVLDHVVVADDTFVSISQYLADGGWRP